MTHGAGVKKIEHESPITDRNRDPFKASWSYTIAIHPQSITWRLLGIAGLSGAGQRRSGAGCETRDCSWSDRVGDGLQQCFNAPSRFVIYFELKVMAPSRGG